MYNIHPPKQTKKKEEECFAIMKSTRWMLTLMWRYMCMHVHQLWIIKRQKCLHTVLLYESQEVVSCIADMFVTYSFMFNYNI